MIIVLDTNIVFSVIANSNGAVSKLFFSSPSIVKYHAPDFLVTELYTHSAKLIRLTGLSPARYEISKASVFSLINFVDTDLIPEEYMKEAAILTKDIDFKDFKFVALSLFLDSVLWTGDRVLYNGIRRRRVMNIVNTKELSLIFRGI